MKKVFLWVMGIVVAVAVFLCLWDGGELTEQEKQAVDKAYAACAHEVDEAANELWRSGTWAIQTVRRRRQQRS